MHLASGRATCSSCLRPAARCPPHIRPHGTAAARPLARPQRALPAELSDPNVVAALVAVVGIGSLGALGFAVRNQASEGAAGSEAMGAASSEPAAPPPPPRENAVLVIGAGGRTGRQTVQQLLRAGRTVVAGLRGSDKEAAVQMFEAAGCVEGRQKGGSGILFYETGVDVTSVEALKRPEIWKGVTQVVTCLGAKFGPQPDGQMGYIDGCTPELVEAQGMANLLSVMPSFVAKEASEVVQPMVAMSSPEEVAIWDRMDDVIMGGNSSSTWEAAPDAGPAVARWKGELVVEGGGFCGARTKRLEASDWSAYDGIALRVKGDGQIFKLNIKTVEQLDTPESTYQTTFDTVAGQWSEVRLPWSHFLPVKRAQSDPDGTPLDPRKIAKLGIVLSRFEFNKMPNPAYRPGPFELLVDGGVRAFRAPRPQIAMVSSAGVERNAIVGDDAARRKQQIPIVQLNPGGTLNHKYAAEIALRSSGYPYCVVRATGMTDSTEGGPYLLEADQGDSMSGAVGRDELGALLTVVMAAPESAGKTFEVRRCEAKDSKGRGMTPQDTRRMLLKLSLDRNRWRVGLGPFPSYVPPPAPPTEERKQEIVADVQRVRAERGVVPQTEAALATAIRQ